MSSKSDLIAELVALISEGQRLEESYKKRGDGTRDSNVPEVEFQAFAVSARASIGRIAGKQSDYYSWLPTQMPDRIAVLGYGGTVISAISGALIGLRNAVDSDLLISIENRLRANVYDDFLTQAEELLNAKPAYHVAAMVLIGGVLENHLSKLCKARSLAWQGIGSLSKYNDLLRDRPDAYDTAVWRRIQAIGDDRNKAAHGKGASVKEVDVLDNLKYVRRLLADYPA